MNIYYENTHKILTEHKHNEHERLLTTKTVSYTHLDVYKRQVATQLGHGLCSTALATTERWLLLYFIHS